MSAVIAAPTAAKKGAGILANGLDLTLRLIYLLATSRASLRISSLVTPLPRSSRTIKIASSNRWGSGDFMTMTRRVVPFTKLHHAPERFLSLPYHFAPKGNGIYRLKREMFEKISMGAAAPRLPEKLEAGRCCAAVGRYRGKRRDPGHAAFIKIIYSMF